MSGFYRRVRNPMYVALTAILAGEALVVGSLRLLVYGLAVWLVFHVYVVSYEEPRERKRFGAEYERYRAAVPRWIPRLRAGKG